MEAGKAHQTFFTKQLINWHHTANDRQLPWKAEKNPYKIWLSEIILQQTRAQQGLPYYLNFIKAYPTIGKMAAANDEDVYRIWQGLGYYNRCRNMLATARYITDELKGKFPQTYEGILALKGIGPYTAAAIASFAYGLLHAVVDGNVYRVLARYFGIDSPTDGAAGKKLFHDLAQELLYQPDSAAHNQAIMDLGATVCTPQKPQCDACPLQKQCVAYRQDMVMLLPVRAKKLKIKERHFNYLLLKHKDKVWVQKRSGKDIWHNLHEFYLIETDKAVAASDLTTTPQYKALKIKQKLTHIISLKQQLTHQTILSQFYEISITNPHTEALTGGKWVAIKDLKKIAFPKTIVSFLEKNFYF
ncbi:A/G-specific adenine glycosylase [Chitinophagaceae bacterium IBVUCB1]|nr:A/G-specific adenine glycosylase [Chitinophagaceae bacterium IBVUCB1]